MCWACHTGIHGEPVWHGFFPDDGKQARYPMHPQCAEIATEAAREALRLMTEIIEIRKLSVEEQQAPSSTRHIFEMPERKP